MTSVQGRRDSRSLTVGRPGLASSRSFVPCSDSSAKGSPPFSESCDFWPWCRRCGAGRCRCWTCARCRIGRQTARHLRRGHRRSSRSRGVCDAPFAPSLNSHQSTQGRTTHFLPPNNPRIHLWTCRPWAGYGEARVDVCEDDARAPHAWTCHLRAPRLPESDSARPPMAQHPPPSAR